MLQVPDHDPERTGSPREIPQGEPRGPQRVGGELQARARPARHQARRLPQKDQPRRAAAALERHPRRHEPRRPTPNRHERDRALWRLLPRVQHGPARHYRHVAGQWPQRHHLRRARRHGHLVRPQLVRLDRPHVPVQDRQSRRLRQRCVLRGLVM